MKTLIGMGLIICAVLAQGCVAGEITDQNGNSLPVCGKTPQGVPCQANPPYTVNLKKVSTGQTYSVVAKAQDGASGGLWQWSFDANGPTSGTTSATGSQTGNSPTFLPEDSYTMTITNGQESNTMPTQPFSLNYDSNQTCSDYFTGNTVECVFLQLRYYPITGTAPAPYTTTIDGENVTVVPFSYNNCYGGFGCPRF